MKGSHWNRPTKAKLGPEELQVHFQRKHISVSLGCDMRLWGLGSGTLDSGFRLLPPTPWAYPAFSLMFILYSKWIQALVSVTRGSSLAAQCLHFFFLFKKIWNASRICMSSLRRGHANLLCIVPTSVYVLLKRALHFIFSLSSTLSPDPTLVPTSPRSPSASFELSKSEGWNLII